MVEPVEDPGKEGMHAEKGTFLAELIELWIAIEKACGDELVKDAHCQWRQDCKENIIECQSPGLENDFAREGIKEGILDCCQQSSIFIDIRASSTKPWAKVDRKAGRTESAYPELRHVECNVLVKRVQNDLGNTLITPGSMHQKQLSQIAELPNSNVGTTRCLQAFHAAYANANMGSLNHGNIVGTVANGQKESLEVSFHELDD